MEKGDYLRGQAVSLGLCEEWTREWPDGLDDEGLCDRYLRGIDFAIKHDWPDKDYIKAHFSDDFRRSHGVFVDEEAVLSDGLDKVVLLGSCTGSLVFKGFDVVVLYVRHDCDIAVLAAELASVRIFAYDRAKVHVIGDSAHNVYVYSYDDSFIRSEGRVIVRQRGYHDEL